MARKLRVELEGGIHHVTLRGNNGQAMFHDDEDRSFFLAELEITAMRHGWTWLSYCLMDNHCHLIIETAQRTLAVGMQRFASRYAQWFNNRMNTHGHVFQGRYWSRLVETDEYFGQALRYVAFNPVKAGLCVEPEEWRWSSHRYLLDGNAGTACARARLEELLAGGPEDAAYPGLFDPDGELAVKFGMESPWDHRPPLQDLLGTRPRDDELRAARRHGYRLAEIATALGVHESTVSRRCKKGV